MKTETIKSLFKPNDWHNAVLNTIDDVIHSKRSFFVKASACIPLSLTGVVTSSADAATEALTFIAKLGLASAKYSVLGTIRVLTWSNAFEPIYKSLPSARSTYRTAKKVVAKTAGIFSSIVGIAVPKANLNLQEKLGNFVNKRKEDTKITNNQTPKERAKTPPSSQTSTPKPQNSTPIPLSATVPPTAGNNSLETPAPEVPTPTGNPAPETSTPEVPTPAGNTETPVPTPTDKPAHETPEQTPAATAEVEQSKQGESAEEAEEDNSELESSSSTSESEETLETVETSTTEEKEQVESSFSKESLVIAGLATGALLLTAANTFSNYLFPVNAASTLLSMPEISQVIVNATALTATAAVNNTAGATFGVFKNLMVNATVPLVSGTSTLIANSATSLMSTAVALPSMTMEQIGKIVQPTCEVFNVTASYETFKQLVKENANSKLHDLLSKQIASQVTDTSTALQIVTHPTCANPHTWQDLTHLTTPPKSTFEHVVLGIRAFSPIIFPAAIFAISAVRSMAGL